MNLSIQTLAIIALAWILSLGAVGAVSYHHGKSYQEGLTAKANVTTLQENLKIVADANNRADKAYQTQLNNAERYAINMASIKASAQTTQQKITDYVHANPAPSSCDLTDELFGYYREAAAATASFSPSRVRAGVAGGSSTTAPAG